MKIYATATNKVATAMMDTLELIAKDKAQAVTVVKIRVM